MLYTLLGRLTWWALRLVLRRRYGRLMVPRPLLAGGLLAAALGVLVLFVRRRPADA